MAVAIITSRGQTLCRDGSLRAMLSSVACLLLLSGFWEDPRGSPPKLTEHKSLAQPHLKWFSLVRSVLPLPQRRVKWGRSHGCHAGSQVDLL